MSDYMINYRKQYLYSFLSAHWQLLLAELSDTHVVGRGGDQRVILARKWQKLKSEEAIAEGKKQSGITRSKDVSVTVSEPSKDKQDTRKEASSLPGEEGVQGRG